MSHLTAIKALNAALIASREVGNVDSLQVRRSLAAETRQLTLGINVLSYPDEYLSTDKIETLDDGVARAIVTLNGVYTEKTLERKALLDYRTVNLDSHCPVDHQPYEILTNQATTFNIELSNLANSIRVLWKFSNRIGEFNPASES
ncbi:hypothetical protein NVP1215B_040 [Vibrio phage 1.215.B._10N.222.54.F7]|nr:hypothetical protein NVP1215A_040 [Vibrio phage 1.215.A._10N.222.54.F7]AUR96063.1 hypothetical protein NVP1215B_040 [Vibrio phage 1.215.B._10N.222.54.F7]